MIKSSRSLAMRPLLRRTLSSVNGIASGGQRQRRASLLPTTTTSTTMSTPHTYTPPVPPIVQPWQQRRVRCLSQHAAEHAAAARSGVTPEQSEGGGVRRVLVVPREAVAPPGRQPRRRPQRGGAVDSTDAGVHGRGDEDGAVGGGSCWISISSTPSFALLDDVLRGVEEAVQVLRSRGDVLRVGTDGGGGGGGGVDNDGEGRSSSDGCEGADATRDEGGVPRPSTMKMRSLDDLERELAENGVGGGGPAEPLPSHLVLEARIILSRLKRPAGWYLRFPHPSIADAIVSQSADDYAVPGEFVKGDIFPDDDGDEAYGNAPAVAPLAVGWKRVFPLPFDPDRCSRQSRVSFSEGAQRCLGDHVVRVENVHPEAIDDRVRSIFRKYDLADERRVEVDVVADAAAAAADRSDDGGIGGEIATGRRKGSVAPPPAVERVVAAGRRLRGGRGRAPDAHTYLVRFGSASAARAAVRDLQFVHLMGRRLILAQYPRQIL